MATRQRLQLVHLLRRATFGPRADEVDAAVRAGFAATVSRLASPTGVDAGAGRTPMPDLGPDPYAALGKRASPQQRQAARERAREQVRAGTLWWLDRMVGAEHQAAEKLVFFWHGHWATSVQKVRSAGLMVRQQEVFRRHGGGDFGAFVKAMLRDPALIVWLDGHRNTRKAPNENLARELMELFTLGVGHYTENDVRAGARALTGWQLDRAGGRTVFNPKRHDPGEKTILGRPGAFDADSLADILGAQPANAEFLARRLWLRYASTTRDIPSSTLAAMTRAYRPGRDTTAMLRALLTDSQFAASAGQQVKQPVEWAVGAMRQLGIRPTSLPAAHQRQLLGGLDALGQVPWRPPSVAGWPSGAAWLTTSATQVRLRLASMLAGHADPAALADLAAAPSPRRVEALARLLVVDAFTDRSRAVLAAAARQVRRLLTLGLASPEYTVH
jgi:uncharacterized protein (DUF1800 family)